MKRLVRFASLTAAVAAFVAAIRALRRQQDPLPAPSSGPTGAPWPPLRPEATATTSVGDATPTPDAAPAPNPPAADEPGEVVVPEPDGIPVAVAEATSPDAAPSDGAAWTEPTAEGGCPEGYPIKAKMGSKIFHAPGQLNYERTTPDRCYASTEAAEADGLRAAKR